MRKCKPITLNGHRVLRLMGLMETMCFKHTNDYGHWYFKNNQVHFKNKIGTAQPPEYRKS